MSDVMHGYRFSWSDQPGGRTTVSATGFHNQADAEAALVRTLRAFRYSPPRWWQWWRAGEWRLSKDLIAKLSAASQGER